VDANFKEVQLQRVKPGQPVLLTSDLYGSEVVYHGRVIGFAGGTGSAFAAIPAQNATGNWIKVVQRVPVRISLDPKQLARHPLRIGLSMQAEVDLHERHGTPVGNSADKALALAAYSATANTIDAGVKARIAAIIAANLK
jgi:membrane fusion protein (multidrug efflux system)